MAARRASVPGRAVSRSRHRGVARAARAGARDAGQLRGHRRPCSRARARCARPLDSGLSRRRLRLHQRGHRARRRPGRRARSPTRSTPSARAREVRAQQTQGRLVRELVATALERRQHRPADRPHPVQAAGAGRDGAVPRRHAPRCRSSSTAAPPASRGSCSTPISTRAAIRARGRSAPSCCASCARPSSAPSVHDASADDGILVIGEPTPAPRRAATCLSAPARRARRGDRGGGVLRRESPERRRERVRRACARSSVRTTRSVRGRRAQRDQRPDGARRCGASSTSPATASRPTSSASTRPTRAIPAVAPAIRAASCCRAAPSSAARDRRACASCPSSCS